MIGVRRVTARPQSSSLVGVFDPPRRSNRTIETVAGGLLALLVRLSRAGAEILWGFEDRRERFPSPGLHDSLERAFVVRSVVHPDLAPDGRWPRTQLAWLRAR
jgi:hypothetical protein